MVPFDGAGETEGEFIVDGELGGVEFGEVEGDAEGVEEEEEEEDDDEEEEAEQEDNFSFEVDGIGDLGDVEPSGMVVLGDVEPSFKEWGDAEPSLKEWGDVEPPLKE